MKSKSRKIINKGPTVPEIVKFFRLRSEKERMLKYMDVHPRTKLEWLDDWRKFLVQISKNDRNLAGEISRTISR